MLCKTSVCSSLRMTISVFILIFSWLSLLTVSSSYRVLCPYSAIIYPIYSIFYFYLSKSAMNCARPDVVSSG